MSNLILSPTEMFATDVTEMLVAPAGASGFQQSLRARLANRGDGGHLVLLRAYCDGGVGGAVAKGNLLPDLEASRAGDRHIGRAGRNRDDWPLREEVATASYWRWPLSSMLTRSCDSPRWSRCRWRWKSPTVMRRLVLLGGVWCHRPSAQDPQAQSSRGRAGRSREPQASFQPGSSPWRRWPVRVGCSVSVQLERSWTVLAPAL